MSKVFLLRHFKSQWNVENRFAGWVDNPISEEGIKMSENIAKEFNDFKMDVVFTSPLGRNQHTVLRTLRLINNKYPIFRYYEGKMAKWGHFEGQGNYVPVYVSEALNERYYGKLQGLNKDEAKTTFGEEQVKLWRRSWDVRPPEGESLKDTYERTIPFYKEHIEPEINAGKDVLIVSSGNALRSIVKYIENIPDEEMINFEIGFGGIVKYEFDGKFKKI